MAASFHGRVPGLALVLLLLPATLEMAAGTAAEPKTRAEPAPASLYQSALAGTQRLFEQGWVLVSELGQPTKQAIVEGAEVTESAPWPSHHAGQHLLWDHMQDARKCHVECGADMECHAKCPKIWEHVATVCGEVKTIQACRAGCEGPERRSCLRSCPESSRPWLAKIGKCTHKMSTMVTKCHELQKVVDCHRACAADDSECHHHCPKMFDFVHQKVAKAPSAGRQQDRQKHSWIYAERHGEHAAHHRERGEQGVEKQKEHRQKLRATRNPGHPWWRPSSQDDEKRAQKEHLRGKPHGGKSHRKHGKHGKHHRQHREVQDREEGRQRKHEAEPKEKGLKEQGREPGQQAEELEIPLTIMADTQLEGQPSDAPQLQQPAEPASEATASTVVV